MPDAMNSNLWRDRAYQTAEQVILHDLGLGEFKCSRHRWVFHTFV